MEVSVLCSCLSRSTSDLVVVASGGDRGETADVPISRDSDGQPTGSSRASGPRFIWDLPPSRVSDRVFVWDRSTDTLDAELDDALRLLRVTAAPIVTARVRPSDRVIVYTEVAIEGVIGDGSETGDWGANLALALRLAADTLSRAPETPGRVLVIACRPPSAHLSDTGEPEWAWPTSQETIVRTKKAVEALRAVGEIVTVALSPPSHASALLDTLLAVGLPPALVCSTMDDVKRLSALCDERGFAHSTDI